DTRATDGERAGGEPGVPLARRQRLAAGGIQRRGLRLRADAAHRLDGSAEVLRRTGTADEGVRALWLLLLHAPVGLIPALHLLPALRPGGHLDDRPQRAAPLRGPLLHLPAQVSLHGARPALVQ